jgi:hypothetical protein
MLSEQLEALAKKHGATSYRNRADTQHPAYGFTPAGLLNLLAEARKQDTELIRQMKEALRGYRRELNDNQPCDAEQAACARLENT